MKFDFSKYQGKYVMHCKTEEEAKDFCRVMHEDGRKWAVSNAVYLNNTKYSHHVGSTCYNFEDGTYCYIEWYKELGFTILEWGDFMEKQFTKADLKSGMVGITRDGCKYIYLNERFMDETGSEVLCFPHEINDDLTVHYEYGNDYDIMRICKSNSEVLNDYFDDENLETIWQRTEEVTEMTVTEIKEALGISGALKIKEG